MRTQLLSICFVISTIGSLLAQPKVYINLNSHNETSGEPAYDAAPGLNYATIYPYIKQMSDSVISKKIKWNFQSDVRFLLGVIKYDTKSASTSNTNILKWMDDSPYIECDPHSHEANVGGSVYNYADVAHLHDSLGVTNRYNVGGFKIDGLQNGSDWQSFEAGMPCSKFKSAPSWKPRVLWGGSYSAGVHNDVNLYGSYKPQSRANYLVDVPTNRLAEQGNGCAMHFTDTTDENRIINELKTIFNNVHNGVYPPTEFYTQCIQFDCRDIGKTNFIKRLCVIIDTVNNYAKKGWVEWMTITEKDEYWRNTLDSAKKYTTCDILTSIPVIDQDQKQLVVYPNPSTNGLFTISASFAVSMIEVTDALGRILLSETKSVVEKQLDLSEQDAGIYFLKVKDVRGNSFSTKITISK